MRGLFLFWGIQQAKDETADSWARLWLVQNDPSRGVAGFRTGAMEEMAEMRKARRDSVPLPLKVMERVVIWG